MAQSRYYTADEVRAALGVSTDEIKDTVVYLPLYENVLRKECAEIGTDCMTDYKTVDGIAKKDRTTEEEDFHLAFSLFAVFSIARALTTSLPLFSPKTIGDGKAAVTRYSDSPYQATIDAVDESYEEYKVFIKEKYAVYNGGSEAAQTPSPMVGVASPAADPVTNT